MRSTDQRQLREVRDETRKALAELCDPIRSAPLLGEGGKLTRHTAPSLLDQLREAVGNSTNRGRRGKGTALPISADALDIR